MKSSIIINHLELDVFLGWPEAERLEKQKVLLDLVLIFEEPPIACYSDNLQDTVCYDMLTQNIKMVVDEKIFHLVEYLAQEIFIVLKKQLPDGTKAQIKIHKKPAIDNLIGGITFCYGDM